MTMAGHRPPARAMRVLLEVFQRHHVVDLLHRRVDDEAAAAEHDQRVTGDLALEYPVQVNPEERLLEGVDQLDDDEQERDPEQDGQTDAELPHLALMFRRYALRFDRDVEQVVEAEHRLQEDQHREGEQVVERYHIHRQPLVRICRKESGSPF